MRPGDREWIRGFIADAFVEHSSFERRKVINAVVEEASDDAALAIVSRLQEREDDLRERTGYALDGERFDALIEQYQQACTEMCLLPGTDVFTAVLAEARRVRSTLLTITLDVPTAEIQDAVAAAIRERPLREQLEDLAARVILRAVRLFVP